MIFLAALEDFQRFADEMLFGYQKHLHVSAGSAQYIKSRQIRTGIGTSR
ncbi:hypothetical protein AB6F62_16585 [Providencia huaxiensis]